MLDDIHHTSSSYLSSVASLSRMWVVVMLSNPDAYLTDFGGVSIDSIDGYATEARAWMEVIKNLLDKYTDNDHPDPAADELMRQYIKIVPAKGFIPSYERIDRQLVWKDIRKEIWKGKKIAERIRDIMHKGDHVLYTYDWEIQQIEELEEDEEKEDEEEESHKRQKIDEESKAEILTEPSTVDHSSSHSPALAHDVIATADAAVVAVSNP